MGRDLNDRSPIFLPEFMPTKMGATQPSRTHFMFPKEGNYFDIVPVQLSFVPSEKVTE